MESPKEEKKTNPFELKKNYQEETSFTKVQDLAKTIIFGIIAVGAAFGWMLLMLLLFSFVALSYVHLTFDTMLWISGACAVLVGIIYIIQKTRGAIKKKNK